MTPPPANRARMFAQIASERNRQTARWGDHDRDHALGVWITILGRQFGQLCGLTILHPYSSEMTNPSVHHPLRVATTATLRCILERVTKVAAVAVTIGEYVLEILEDRGEPEISAKGTP